MKVSLVDTIKNKIGLPEDVKPLSSKEFAGYFFRDTEKGREIYAPGEDGVYYLRNIIQGQE